MTRLPYLYFHSKGAWHTKLLDLHETYGPVVRYTSNEVSFISPEASRRIYGHRTSNQEQVFQKDTTTYYQVTPTPHIINADDETHRRQRRLLSHAFSEKALRDQEPVLKYYVDLFVVKLTHKARAGEPLDIVNWFNYATFDLIGDLAYGESFGCLEREDYHPWISMIFAGVKFLAVLQVIRRLRLEGLVNLLMPASLKKASDEHEELSRSTALKRMDTGGIERGDFMSFILKHNDTEKGMSREEIAGNASILIIAGSETTATLLSGVVFQLLSYPKLHERLVKEIRTEFASEDEITLARVNQLTYLIAVLSEGLRICECHQVLYPDRRQLTETIRSSRPCYSRSPHPSRRRGRRRLLPTRKGTHFLPIKPSLPC